MRESEREKTMVDEAHTARHGEQHNKMRAPSVEGKRASTRERERWKLTGKLLHENNSIKKLMEGPRERNTQKEYNTYEREGLQTE